MIQLIQTTIREFDTQDEYKTYLRKFKDAHAYTSTFLYDLEKQGEAHTIEIEKGVKVKMTMMKRLEVVK